MVSSFLERLAARAGLLWLASWYLAAIFGMTVAPAVLVWRWFEDGVHPGIAALLALIGATLPLMVGSWAITRGGVFSSRIAWRIWVYGWALLGGALFLTFVLH